ncbi:hypothetical protein ACROYT_G022469 [Oculina patagonica]
MYLADTLSRAAPPQMPTSDATCTPGDQIFNICGQTEFEEEIESINQTDFLKVTDSRLKQIQQQTVQDTALQVLKSTILAGWPETKEEVSVIVREYWAYRDELTAQNGVLFKGSRIIIPKSMRPEMLVRIHSSHLGAESCLRKAQDVLYWPNMSNEVRDMVGQCSACNEYQQSQCKEPLMTHEIPGCPWSRVAMDIFTLDGEDYLITVDFYSDFWEVDTLPNMTSETVIERSKALFSRYGVPEAVIGDNGGQFASEQFTNFARDWEFEHITTSPYHSQSNGKVESAVKIAKKIMKKAKRSGQDVWKAILDWRNTPTENMGSSPAQRLMSRRTRTLLPTANQLLRPQVVEGVAEKIKVRRQKAKHYFDRGSKELPELKIGQPVRVKPSPSQRENKWRLGTCVQQVAPRSYIVDVSGREYRWNRKFLRTTLEPVQEEPDTVELSTPDTPEPEMGLRAPPLPPTPKEPGLSVLDEPDVVEPLRQTRTRTVRLPEHINDCSPNPCQHGGNCTDKVNDYNCTCVVGYRGKDCEINIADCAGSPCQNNGRCTDLVNDYNCTCIPGYTGKNCTQDSFLWYLFPAGASRVYGYDTENNKSFESNVLPDGANVTLKEGFHGLCIPMKKEVIVGHFADQCLGNSSTCDSFTISFLAYVDGAVAKNEDVHILYSTPLTQGLYHVQFTVTRTVSRLEGQANIVGGNSSTLLERKGQFPGVNKWVHVAIVYSQSLKKLDLYMNSAKVTDPLGDIPWNNNRSAVSVSLASTGNQKDICVSYFQIIKGVLTEKEIQQLEQESRTQGSNPSMVEAKLLQTNLITNEDVGRLAVPVERRGNVFIASVLTFNSSNQDAIFHVDFNHPLHHELLIKPGEETAEISVNITEDDLHESNETFLLTLMSLDKVTTITGGSTTITILNNDIDECAPKPCLNGATCVDLVHDYNCTCVLGYTGRNCSTNIDDCTNGTCKNNGTCHDLVNDFICTCAPGFTGKTCNNDIDECSAAPCKNGAQCTNLINDYSCNCTGGFEGKNCSTDIDECSAAPCKNGAQCTNLIDDYRCKCTEGFEGKDCSTASASTEEESDELLRILFWACVGALAVCLLALITVGPYLCHKLKRTARLKQSGGHRNGWQYTGDLICGSVPGTVKRLFTKPGVRLKLEYAREAWDPHYKKDIDTSAELKGRQRNHLHSTKVSLSLLQECYKSSTTDI